MQKKQSIFSLQFILLCFSGFLFFGSFNMMIPELPAYLDTMNGGQFKGFIVFLFTLAAGISRPFSGKLADRVGRVPVMIVGAAVSGIAALFYPMVTGLAGFFVLRFFHGFSTGFKPTGTAAYVADIVSDDRRGEAMGFLGFFSSLGMATGLSLGPHIVKLYSFDAMFYCSGIFAILSVLILIGMKETLQEREKISREHFRIKLKEVFEPNVISPSFMLMLSVFSFGTVLTIIPDLSDHIGISNRGMFFTYFTLASLLVRIIAGKASDKFGRVKVLKVGNSILMTAMIVVANADNELMFTIGACLFGFGIGISSPTIFAWTIDLSHEKHIGRGFATMYIALEIGIGLGAFISGWVYQNDVTRIPFIFYIAASLVLVGFVYLFSNNVKHLAKAKT